MLGTLMNLSLNSSSAIFATDSSSLTFKANSFISATLAKNSGEPLGSWDISWFVAFCPALACSASEIASLRFLSNSTSLSRLHSNFFLEIAASKLFKSFLRCEISIIIDPHLNHFLLMMERKLPNS